jgi:hypothetical protein
VDTACQVGAVFLIAALVATLASVGYWASHGFGPLEAGAITRTASLVAVLAALGVQSVTNGFLWGLLTQKASASADAPAAEPARV